MKNHIEALRKHLDRKEQAYLAPSDNDYLGARQYGVKFETKKPLKDSFDDSLPSEAKKSYR